MAQTFEQMCAERDPLYAAMQPNRYFAQAVHFDRVAHDPASPVGFLGVRDMALLTFVIWALYHDRR